MKVKKVRFDLFVVGTCAALSVLLLSNAAFGQAWTQTTCQRSATEGQDTCDATPFLNANIGTQSGVSYHHDIDHNPNFNREFDYTYLTGPFSDPLSLVNKTNVENGLFHKGEGTMVELPIEDDRDYVTFIYRNEHPGRVNFIAVNSNNTIIDEATKGNPQSGFEVVTLGPHPQSGSTYDIDTVYMWHVEASTCNKDLTEPTITEVRACDVEFP
jgi:hypothetical protein